MLRKQIIDMLAADIGQGPKLQEFPNFDKKLGDFAKYCRIGAALERDLALIRPYEKLFNIPTFLGTEVEVENMHKTPALPDFWEGKPDGSLRNGGLEFYSVPLPPQQMMVATVALWTLIGKLRPADRVPDFSWRSSIHVHLNVLSLTEDEFKTLMILSALFEPLLFGFAGKDREQSMFCVPLTQSSSFKPLAKFIQSRGLSKLAQEWPKYTAVNLCRMWPFGTAPALGTVEFRHLGGTDDVKTVLMWQAIILQLFQAAISIPPAKLAEIVLDMSGLVDYENLFDEVFVVQNKVLRPSEFPWETVAKVKELFVPTTKLGQVKPTSAMATHAKKMLERYEKEKALKKPVSKKVKPMPNPFVEEF